MSLSCPKFQQQHELACPSLDLIYYLCLTHCYSFNVFLAVPQIFQAGSISGHLCWFPLPGMPFMEAPPEPGPLLHKAFVQVFCAERPSLTAHVMVAPSHHLSPEHLCLPGITSFIYWYLFDFCLLPLKCKLHGSRYLVCFVHSYISRTFRTVPKIRATLSKWLSEWIKGTGYFKI